MSYKLISRNIYCVDFDEDCKVSNDYIEETEVSVTENDDDTMSYIIGSSKNVIECFNLYGTSGKDEKLRKKLNKIKNDLFLNNSKCCVEGCDHISPKTGKECKRVFALHLGIEDESKFYMLAIGCCFLNTMEIPIRIKKGSPVAFRPYNEEIKIPYLLKTNIELRRKLKDLKL